MPGLYQPGSEDYTKQISEFKKFGAEICAGAMTEGDFTNFWKQAIQQGFHPKMCTVGQALNFAEAANAIGPTVVGLTTEISWHPDYPYKRLLHGQDLQAVRRRLRDGHRQAVVGRAHHATPSWSGSSRASRAAPPSMTRPRSWQPSSPPRWRPSTARSTSRCRWTRPRTGDVTHPVPNCLRMPTAAGQWLKGTKWPYEKFLVDNKFVSGAVITQKVQEIQYTAY